MTVTVSPDTYDPVSFDGWEEFDHFADPAHPDCFACNSRRLLSEPLLVTDEFMLMEATAKFDNGSFRVLPGCWLVFPRRHVTSLLDLPDNWTASVKQAVRHLGLDYDYNTSENSGPKAGQTAPHIHTWIIGRQREAGLLCENTGLAGILRQIRELGIPAV